LIGFQQGTVGWCEFWIRKTAGQNGGAGVVHWSQSSAPALLCKYSGDTDPDPGVYLLGNKKPVHQSKKTSPQRAAVWRSPIRSPGIPVRQIFIFKMRQVSIYIDELPVRRSDFRVPVRGFKFQDSSDILQLIAGNIPGSDDTPDPTVTWLEYPAL
jgi:hypothetical protein